MQIILRGLHGDDNEDSVTSELAPTCTSSS
jgi:hypothetical protein